MHNTGRIKEALVPEARRIVFGRERGDDLRQALSDVAMIDRAHIVMLTECHIVQSRAAREALSAINSLEGDSFASVIGQEQIRGSYMLYEAALTNLAPAAADMHIARSRNDISATAFLIRCRRMTVNLAHSLLRLRRSAASSIECYGTTSMPVFSHRRPGMPGSWELYLSAFESALVRDFSSLRDALQCMEHCPMGAGAGAGTELPIDPDRTAALLGFRTSSRNSLDAVASRDAGFRALAAAAVMASTIGRVVNDLLVWYGEHDALEFPDNLVGASSIMPQKRNAFLLEHIAGKCGLVLGQLTASLASAHGSAFANSIAVGTEATSAVSHGLEVATEAVTLHSAHPGRYPTTGRPFCLPQCAGWSRRDGASDPASFRNLASRSAKLTDA